LISIIAILNFLIGLFFLVMGVLLAMGTVAITDLDADLQGLGTVGGAVLVIIGILYLVIAGGLWNGWRIMWYLSVIVTAISLILGIASLFTGTFVGIISLIIDILILYYLFRPGVKEFFGI
jgi:uncharacterized membrane protein (DUF2068 family)